MIWERTFAFIKQYMYVSTNQHGDRYRPTVSRRVSCAKLTAKVNCAENMRQLILLSYHLEVPVHYDFSTDPHTAFIEITSKESVSP